MGGACGIVVGGVGPKAGWGGSTADGSCEMERRTGTGANIDTGAGTAAVAGTDAGPAEGTPAPTTLAVRTTLAVGTGAAAALGAAGFVTVPTWISVELILCSRSRVWRWLMLLVLLNGIHIVR